MSKKLIFKYIIKNYLQIKKCQRDDHTPETFS